MTQTPQTSLAELAEFGASIRAALTTLSGSEQVRAALFADPDPRTWAVLAGQLELPGLLLAEEHGGSGLTTVEAAVAFEEAGRALVPGPLFATAALAVPLLVALGDAGALARYGPPIASGELTATVALAESDGRWSPDAVTCRAEPEGGGWALTGGKELVVDGATAGLLLVVARSAEGELGVFAVEPDAAGLERTALVTLDLTRRMARLTLDGVPATRVGGDASGAVAAASDVARLLLAAEQVGGAQRCLDMVVEYAGQRIQFARPIGSFQAIKQRLADALVQIESARSAVHAAARSTGRDLARDSRVAALLATEAYTFISAQNIQLHGGIGFTWEHDAHLYFKRARAGAQLLGGPGDHVAALADVLDTEID
ncbi:acyl-CoA dehydrogenase family protein [Blastococcus sp. TF02A-26]|uniref:acyl-CoA dehydrogenase family protein n=1 Tax=Blastococcus sp. TF02A-26 TaxID=2250577 RepID=UPI000DEB5B60|nr:acyl-CoA dehydrogenase [Blastococcus sp. TF02A-26]RBY84382.1 acyl-CoA dehydrogenase [Blastococcus sp. TF02A-26]